MSNCRIRSSAASLGQSCLVAALALGLGGCVGDPRPEELETGPFDAATDGGVDADHEQWPPTDADVDGEPPVDADDDRICPANGNGVLEAPEVQVSFDLALRFRAQPLARQVEVDLSGPLEDGQRTWHFEEPVAGERVVEEQARPVAGTWFAGQFPSATHAAPLSEQHGFDGVYRLDDEALWLLGFVSSEGQGTRVSYDPALPIVRFPLAEGESWSATVTGSGRMSWVPFYDTEEYTFTVDAAGVAIVPAGRYPVLRVRTELAQTVGLITTRRISYSFMAECWGRVAQVTSRDNERQLDFSTATDYRRLAFD